ncbi:nascent polypeptide-associated complex subunit alpha muscle-specific form [Drosophila madeirensis]|uniref:Nascent polypeptide-associated complex subunit alpha muscle-specific form n=1 Tax=Drosophila madeirensis TaxID=30013 RepID=A0AAU9F8Y9_DROMD
MLSKMAQPNNVSGGGGTGGGVAASGSGRRLPLTLGAGTAVSRSQQGGGSPQNGGKKAESFGAGPFVSLKKTSAQRSGSTSSSSSGSTPKEDEKKSTNGVGKSANGKDKTPQNGNSAKEQKPKEKVEKLAEKRDNKDAQENTNVNSEKEAKQAVADTAPIVKEKTVEIDLTVAEPNNDVVVVQESSVKVPTTPTGERKSLRKAAAASQQKSPSSKQSSSPATKKQTETAVAAPEPVVETPATPQEDVEMEPLTMDDSPIRSVTSAVGHLNAQPAATSTPGRRLFGFVEGTKPPSNEVNLVAQPSSPAPVRTFAQISGRRSIRNTTSLTPSKVGTYRCTNNDLDTSNCTNYSMNATVGSEIPNSSSFSFSFFGRGRKRERTPPQQLLGSQSTTDLPLEMQTSPPKRARFDLFSLNLASPFSLLRSRFSKTVNITSPQRLRLDQSTTEGDENGKVQDVQCIAVEMDQQQLNISSGSAEEQDKKEVTVGQEAGLETPKKAGSPDKEIHEKEINNGTAEADGENISSVAEAAVEVSVGENRSRCSIM